MQELWDGTLGDIWIANAMGRGRRE